MESISEMHDTMSHVHHVSPIGLVEQALGFAGHLSAELLIVLTSAPVLKLLATLVLLLALAALLRPVLARHTSQS